MCQCPKIESIECTAKNIPEFKITQNGHTFNYDLILLRQKSIINDLIKLFNKNLSLVKYFITTKKQLEILNSTKYNCLFDMSDVLLHGTDKQWIKLFVYFLLRIIFIDVIDSFSYTYKVLIQSEGAKKSKEIVIQECADGKFILTILVLVIFAVIFFISCFAFTGNIKEKIFKALSMSINWITFICLSISVFILISTSHGGIAIVKIGNKNNGFLNFVKALNDLIV